MKKWIFGSVLLLLVGMLTGCQKTEKLNCTKTETSSENLALRESLNLTFKGNEVTKMEIYSEIEVSGSYLNYIEDLATSLKQQYKDLEGKKGIDFSTNQVDNVLSVTITANLKKMNKDAKEELSIGSVKQSLKEVKAELEAEGYTC